jgi:hypothetical protein
MRFDMEAELERRLDRLGRRQRYTLLLPVYPYPVGGLWTLTGRVDATALALAVVPGLGVTLVAYLAALYRARTGSAA